jgi:Mg2+-importing ATPase
MAMTKVPWSLAPEALFEELRSSETGLDDGAVAARLAEHGENRLRAARRPPFVEALLSQTKSPLLWLLLGAAAVSMAVGERVDAIIVMSIVVLGSVVSIVQEGRAGNALAKLRERIVQRARVVRAARELVIPATQVVPGDIITLAAGSLVPADAIVVDAKDLFLAESALTGEAFPVEKRPGEVPADTELAYRTNVVHMGTSVRSGEGRALVVATGKETAFGRLATRLAAHAPETDFVRGLRRFGYLLVVTMLVLVVVVFLASALRHHPPVEALLFAVALSVGLAPEMLPAILATMLSHGARRMGQRGVLVRRLEAIENLGNMDVLCTDKTGTLTEGDARLERATDPTGADSLRVARLAFHNASLQTGIENPLDRAILAAFEGEDARWAAPPEAVKIDEVPFDFTRKRITVLLEANGAEPRELVMKGALEPVLGACTSVASEGGEPLPLDDERRTEIRARVDAWGGEGVRALAIATRPFSDARASRHDERGFVLEGFVTFRDPEKAGVEEVIARLRARSVRVVVASGDHRAVVKALGAAIGLRTGRVLTGGELATMHDDALVHVVEDIDLFAEIDPGQKERILAALKKHGHVVGFMGDGINDAPALHAADVGISVDHATDVAREAADFVLLESDLGLVHDGVMEGRRTFANTMKYVLTTESANLGNMISMAAATLFLPFLPLLAHQILLNNFLSDVPSATLSADRVDPELVDAPRRWDIAFIRRFMIVFGLISALFDGLTFFVLTAVFRAGPEEFHTAWFAESLLTELLVLLVLRTRRRFFASPPHLALLVSTLAVVLITVVLPLLPIRDALGFVEMPLHLWLVVFAVALGYVAVVELVKRPILARLERARRAPGPGRGLWYTSR